MLAELAFSFVWTYAKLKVTGIMGCPAVLACNMTVIANFVFTMRFVADVTFINYLEGLYIFEGHDYAGFALQAIFDSFQLTTKMV